MSKLPSGIQQHFWRDVGHSVRVTQSPTLTDIVGNLFNVSLNRYKLNKYIAIKATLQKATRQLNRL